MKGADRACAMTNVQDRRRALAPPDGARGNRALSRVLGDRPALLASSGRIRRGRRDRPGERSTAAGGLAVGVGLTASVTTAVSAGAAVLIVRLLEDYIVMPRVLGDAVGLSPLLVLVAVTACGVVFGGLAVLLAIPVAAVLVTRLDVLILKKTRRSRTFLL